MSPDDLVNLLSRWLAGHVRNDELRLALDDVGTLSADQAEAVEELRDELARSGSTGRGGLEMAVRETLEFVALG